MERSLASKCLIVMGVTLVVMVVPAAGRMLPGERAAVVKASDRVFVGYVAGSVDRIDYSLYTHLCHAFVLSDGQGKVFGEGTAPSKELTARAHRANVKVLLSLGGWGSDEAFAALVSKPESEDRYIRAIMEIVDRFDYDGVDIDWEYPDTATEVVGFERLARRFRKLVDELGKNKGRTMLVTFASSSNEGTLRWLSTPFVIETLDWVNVMTYDYTGDWSDYAGHHSPLFASKKQPPGRPRSAVATIEFLLKDRKLPAEKIALGLPLYGRGFAVKSPYESTKKAGRPRYAELDYRSIAKLSRQKGWMRTWDDETKNPWLISTEEPLVIGYDDAESLAIRTEWAMKQGLRGVFFWQINQDRMADGTHPLEQAAHRAFLAGRKTGS
jgi:chitinase